MKIFICLIIIATSASSLAQTNTTVFPEQLRNEEGNSNYDLFRSLEYQQLFRASALGSLWTTPVNITGMSMRVNSGSGSFDAVIPRIEIRFSTSSRPPEQISRFYVQNRGPDETTVFSQSNLHFVSSDSTSPNAFDLTFRFDKPFVYDPKAGHLLMYITQMDAAAPITSPVDGEVFGDLNTTPSAAYFPQALVARPFAIATEFQWTAIPEPNLIALLALGSGLFLIKSRRRITRHNVIPTRFIHQ